jgi:uncharacterized membrane protein HdeD (DUF308 family)
MTEHLVEDVEKLRRRLAAEIHEHWKVFLVQGIVMMGLGVLAIALPEISTLAIEIIIGWLLFIGGIFRTVMLLRAKRIPGFGWSLAAALAAVALGVVLVIRPLEGVLTLTMVLAVFFVVEGIAAILLAVEFRRRLHNWGWILLNGLVSLLLAFLIVWGWPSTAAWAIGLLVGINMLFFGLSLTMTALAARLMTPG